MSVGEIVCLVVGVPVALVCLYLLWTIFRFAIISSVKTNGSKDRLRKPELEEVSRVCGFELPQSLADFYRSSPLVELVEFYSVDQSKVPPKGWFIGGFIPLAAIDAEEERKISQIDGVPLADDCDGGVYYLTESGAVMLNNPRSYSEDLFVAGSFDKFANFVVLETPTS